ncbi:MAG TPA: methyltransferase domain-containing protein [Sphingomicrobium sp.]|nr:methyltransferase domain-containing protein [Sphingomicrobium sp.]
MTALSTHEAYRLWAPAYSDETAISQLEDQLVRGLTPCLDGLRLLDAGCGTGRRLVGCGAAEAVGVDISADMLNAAPDLSSTSIRTVLGDIRKLPFTDGSFDVVWCRLVIGHVSDCAIVYRELARTVRFGGHVIVSDFHAAAHAAGHRRTFRAAGAVHEVEHYVHGLPVQQEAARAAGLQTLAAEQACVGPGVRHFYESRGRTDLYDEHLGLPVVLALSFRRAD